jgi:triacylglycerol lipase
MVKRITQLLLLLQGLVAFAIALGSHSVLHLNWLTSILMGLGLILVVRMGITANNFFINRYYCGESSDEARLSWNEWLSLYLIEFRSTMYCSSWAMPFFAFSRQPAARPAGLPVLLVHGYGCNSGYWLGMSKALAKASITHHAIDLEPVFADIDDYVPSIRDAVDVLCAETGYENIIIVAHSMGGLAARAYLRSEGDAKIAKVITLGSPHRGTGLANFGVGPNSQQMRRTGTAQQGEVSDWLCRLESGESERRMSRFVSIYSCHDNIIAPQTSSCLPGAKNVSLKGIGHVALAYTPAVQERVTREILATADQKY